MKYFLSSIMALFFVFSTSTFSDEQSAPFTVQDCILIGEVAYNIAKARDMDIPAGDVLSAITESNGDPSSEELLAFTEFVEGIYADTDTPESLGVAIIQSCIDDISNQ